MSTKVIFECLSLSRYLVVKKIMFADENDEDFENNLTVFEKKRLKIEKKSPTFFLENSMNSVEVVAASARLKLSNSDFLYITAAFAKAIGHDISNSKFSLSTVRLKRFRTGKMLSKRIQEDFAKANPLYLVIHWDGMLMPDITNGKARCLKIGISKTYY